MTSVATFCKRGTCRSALKPEPNEISLTLKGISFTILRGEYCSGCARAEFEGNFVEGFVKITGHGLVVDWKQFNQSSPDPYLVILRAAGLLYHGQEPQKARAIVNTDGRSHVLDQKKLYFARPSDAEEYQKLYRRRST